MSDNPEPCKGKRWCEALERGLAFAMLCYIWIVPLAICAIPMTTAVMGPLVGIHMLLILCVLHRIIERLEEKP